MPLRGTGHSQSVFDEAPYFTSLSQLDDWADKPVAKLYGVLPYVQRSKMAGNKASQQGKLLVCHDYKGGYTEKPSSLSYTFNFWSFCEIFIYFAHHRVSIPPSGWVTASHRQGVKILGTLIFEGSGEEDCLRLLFGRLPASVTGPAASTRTLPSANSFPVSPHYARILAQLAHQRGFDGYLLNFECPLRGGPEQTRALSAWISLLRSELQTQVGPHTEVVWYDSIIYTGELRWQDRLNNYNLPFFPPSTALFTNYTWLPSYPAITAKYFLDTKLKNKKLNDLYFGVDVWGRGVYGDGGLNSHVAIAQIDPKSLGLSVAMFGQAWTWESEQDKPGWNWEEWWKYERKLWLGPESQDEVVSVPDLSELSMRKRAMSPHVPLPGPFKPITWFFTNVPPPNPVDLPFFTCFSPGIGRKWFIQGSEKMVSENGWTDVQKQCSLGNLLWPRPGLQWEDGGGQGPLPKSTSALEKNDAWLGGSSLRLSLSFVGDEDAFFRCVWIPIQSIAIAPRVTYEISLVYKADSPAADLEVAASIRSDYEFDISSMSSDDLQNGWTKLHIQFSLQKDLPAEDILSSIGLIVGCATEDPSLPCDCSILLGLLTVSPTVPAQAPKYIPKLLWADYRAGAITWEFAASFDPFIPSSLIRRQPDDPTQIWELAPSSFFPDFIYFNLYVERKKPNGSYLGPNRAAEFIGTTGWNGRINRFHVEKTLLPESLQLGDQVRFYVQGVTDRGEVLDWPQNVFVETELQF